MEGSNKTPYEPPSNLGTMEGSSSVGAGEFALRKASFHGFIPWPHFMASLHGLISWLHFMVSFHGLISWLQSMAAFQLFYIWGDYAQKDQYYGSMH